MEYSGELSGSFNAALSPRTSVLSGDRRNEDTFAQHFIKTLHRKLQDPSLLQVCPPPPPEIFKHNGKNDAQAGGDRPGGLPALGGTYHGHPDAWGSPKHPFGAPPGAFKLLSSDYAWLDAPRQTSRRDANAGGGKPDPALDAEDTPMEPPEPPLYMQRTRFMAHSRLVFVKLRQQLEEVCVAAVRRIEAAASPPGLAPSASEALTPGLLSTLPSFNGSVATTTFTATGMATSGGALASTRSLGAGSNWGGASFSAASAAGGGGVRLAPGLVDEVLEGVRSKLHAAFEDCLTDTMDQLWGAVQYAGSKHALVERMAEAMRQRETELEATAAKYREEAASRYRALRKQKEEIEAQAEKDRTELRALAAAANQRVDFLERDLAASRAALDRERAQVVAKLETQRATSEAALQAKDEALEAVRADSVARLEELRVLAADLQQQLSRRQEEVARLSARATDQADMLALALARRDGTSAELEMLSGQLEDFKRFVTASIKLPLTDWLRTLRENNVPLTPLIGGPLTMEYGTGRAFVASARNLNLHAVLEELRRTMPKQLPWPEDGWPPDGQEEGYNDEETATSSGSPPRTRSPSPLGPELSSGKNPLPPTLPLTWHRFVRAPLGDICAPKDLMSQLAALGRAKWEADRAARDAGLPHPDLHAFIYKHMLAKHGAAVDADEEVVNLLHSLRVHARGLPRAALWLQLLQLSGPVLPLDGCAYYLEVFHAMVSSASPGPGGRSSSSVVADKSSGTVWVSPTRWKALLTRQFMQVYDTERKAVLLKQAAAARVDTNRGNKTFGMTDVDSLMAAIMDVWISQRQAALSDLAVSWTAMEPVGGGMLAVNIDVEQLTRIAEHALGPGVVPPDRDSRLALYADTVQAARATQAAARIKWSGLTTAALGTALAAAELLPPRPLSYRGCPTLADLAAAGGLVLRLTEAAAGEMRSEAGFQRHKALEALEGALGRARGALEDAAREPLGPPRPRAEEEALAADGWAALQGLVGALLSAQEAFRGFEAGLHEAAVRAAVEAAHREARTPPHGGGEGADGGRRLNAMRSRASRNHRNSLLHSNSGDGAGPPPPPDSGGGGTPTRSSGASPQQVPLHWSQSALQRSSRFGSQRPSSGRGGLGQTLVASPRDLRAALASARWSSEGEEDHAAAAGERAQPQHLHGRSRQLLQQLSRSFQVRSGSGGVEPRRATVPRADSAFSSAAGAAAAAAAADAEASHGQDPGLDQDLDPDSNGLLERMTQLEDKYGRLRSRHDETARAVAAAYAAAAAAAADGGDAAAASAGPGLPSPEVMAQLGPAAKLRLVAELLAELHREVEQGVWPQLDTTVRAAIGAPGSGGGSGSRPSSAPLAPPGVRLTVRPLPSRLSIGAAAAAAAAAEGALMRQSSAVSSVAPAEGEEGDVAAAEGVLASGAGACGEGERKGATGREERQQQQQQEEEEEEEAHPVEVAEVTGRLHAHAGHVGQVMASAALEAAALAAALDDLSSWRSPRARSTSIRRLGCEAAAAAAADGLSVVGYGADSLSGRLSSDSGGTGGGGSSSAPWMSTPSTCPPGDYQLGTGNAAADFYGSGGGAAAAGPSHASSLLRRSRALQRLASAGAAYTDWCPDRPLSARSRRGSGGSLSDGSAEPGDGSDSVGRSHGSGIGSGGASGAGIAGGEEEAGPADPWDALPHDADPRDTVYLDALRALHLAAEAQSSSPATADAVAADVGPMVAAVREVVRLMGGQPQVTGDGRVIEFFPRRLPTDWRHPVLRNSLTRLYIYVCGVLLQQHERAALLREAASDLKQRHEALARAAGELSAKAEELRRLEVSLGAQLGALAAWVTHGSVLMERLGKLEETSGALVARVADVRATERGLPAPSTPQPGSSTTVGGPLSRTNSARVSAPVAPTASTLSRPSSVRVPSLLSRTSTISPVASASVSAPPTARDAAAPQLLAMNDLAVLAAAAAAAAATAAAYAAEGSAAASATGGSNSGSATPSLAAAPLAGALPAASPPSPPSPVASSVYGRGSISSLRPPSKVVFFSVEEWEDVREVVTSLAAAVARVRSAAAQMAAVVRPTAGGNGDGAAAVAAATGPTGGEEEAASPAPRQPGHRLLAAAPRLPNGDHILEVYVHMGASGTGSPGATAAPEPQQRAAEPEAAGGTAATAPALVPPADAAGAAAAAPPHPCGSGPGSAQQEQLPPQPSQPQQLQQAGPLTFVVELPLVAEEAPAATGGPVTPRVAVSTAAAAVAAAAEATAGAAPAACGPGTTGQPAAAAAAAGDDDSSSAASGSDDDGGGRPRRLRSGDQATARSVGAAVPGGGGCPADVPPAATPAVSPEASRAALPAPAGYYIRMALRLTHATPTSKGGGGGSSDSGRSTDLSALPPGEALVQLSDSLLRRSAQAAVRKHRGPLAAAATAGGRGVVAASVPASSAPALGPPPAYYERRPMTARAFVEGVMAQAREEQLQRLYGSAGPMPLGGLPEVEGIARMDQHEVAALEARRTAASLQLAGSVPEPITALEALLWEHREQAAAASAAAASAVAEAVSAAAAAAGLPPPEQEQQQQQQQQHPGSAGPAGAALKRRGPASARQRGARSPSPPQRKLPAGGGGGASGEQRRLWAAVTGTRLATLPPVAAVGGGLVLGPRSTHLGYYPGLQVDAGGRVVDWRLPLLAPFSSVQLPLRRHKPAERKQP